jgi:ABC-type transporter Mla MlaB component
MEPVLELWVDIEREPVTIRLAGKFDEATSASVVPIIEELVAQGHRDFAMQVDELEPLCTSGYSLLVRMEHLVKRAGGSVSWSVAPDRLLMSTPPQGGTTSVTSTEPVIGGTDLQRFATKETDLNLSTNLNVESTGPQKCVNTLVQRLKNHTHST